jgi:hypothetical protein
LIFSQKNPRGQIPWVLNINDALIGGYRNLTTKKLFAGYPQENIPRRVYTLLPGGKVGVLVACSE